MGEGLLFSWVVGARGAAEGIYWAMPTRQRSGRPTAKDVAEWLALTNISPLPLLSRVHEKKSPCPVKSAWLWGRESTVRSKRGCYFINHLFFSFGVVKF